VKLTLTPKFQNSHEKKKTDAFHENFCCMCGQVFSDSERKNLQKSALTKNCAQKTAFTLSLVNGVSYFTTGSNWFRRRVFAAV